VRERDSAPSADGVGAVLGAPWVRSCVMGEYVAERKRNPFVSTAAGARALSAMQLPLFALRPPRGYGVLTTTGRTTGKRRRRCVRAIEDGNRVYLVAIKGARTGWQRNLRANPNARLRLRGGSFAGVARELHGAPEAQRAREVYCHTVYRFDRASYTMWHKGRPTPENIREMLRGWFDQGTAFVIELAE
jgi:deazaflavin-dependent oxidoreductase (nitroreductase family)